MARDREDDDVPEGCKRCNKCHEIKLLSEFYRHTEFYRTRGDAQGYYGRCKACKDAQAMEYQARNRKRLNAYLRKFRQQQRQRQAVKRSKKDDHEQA